MADEPLPFQSDSNPPSPIHASNPSNEPEQPHEHPQNRPEIERILGLASFPEQVDNFARLRSCFKPEDDSHSYPAIQAYLSGELELEDAVNKIAEPIEKAYSSADHGCALDPSNPNSGSSRNRSTEGFLRDLWYSVLHSAKRIPWNDSLQEKLLSLVQTVKLRPDPPRNFDIKKTKSDGVLSSSTLWSSLLLLGPTTRESFNDSPGVQAGYQPPEIAAWANFNAFLARLTSSSIANFWIYAIWELRSALETRHEKTKKYTLDAAVPSAAVWVLILGKTLYDKEEDLTPKEANHGSPARPGELWQGGKPEFSKARWGFWRGRFAEVAEDEGLRMETSRIAGMASEFMGKVERE
ncbi:hypothetical protein K469DRAFT_719311 [Zopfia rhizophila CBS 207.26]|uniref:Uncharacterized protein n=1 Tax=Zopfia rhizophila CBS 207.26 TaxID=1314779 RepID=A0A6A6DIT3_9PEZI|nr:hypothetical protein K469DRAFT_719311 [Zopfia rhizophila CBS 207.26]